MFFPYKHNRIDCCFFFILYILNRIKQNHEIVLICIPCWLKMLNIKKYISSYIIWYGVFLFYPFHINILSESCTFIGISFLWFWKLYNIFENIFCVFFFFLLHLQFIEYSLYSDLQLWHIQVMFYLFIISKFIFPVSDTISTELLFHLFFLILTFILVWVFFRNFLY